MQFVISCLPDGTIEHTRVPPNVFDLKLHKEVRRVSEIEFDEDGQFYYIKWLRGPYANKVHSYSILNSLHRGGDVNAGSATVPFTTYEAAVSHEVYCLNRMRIDGHTFG